MLENKFVIFSPGRTGSILIARALSDILGKEIKYIDESKIINDDDWIVHTHNTKLIVPNKSQWTMIVSRRKDKVKGAISQITAEITNEYNTYSNQIFPQQYVTIESFTKLIQQRDNFYNNLDCSNYANVVDIYLEDMLQYPYYLFEEIGYKKIKMPIWTEQCPYSNKLVLNIKELEDYYQNVIVSRT
jgi:hypothetical protein